MFANNDDDSRLVLLLITHSHTCIHSHTHMFDSRSWVTDASFPHMDIVPAHTHKHTNADCFVSQGCSQAIKRVCILDTLLQLASLNMQHTFTPMHKAHSISLIPVSLILSLSLSFYHEICVHISQMQQVNLAPKASPTQRKLTYRQRQQDTQAPRPRHEASASS